MYLLFHSFRLFGTPFKVIFKIAVFISISQIDDLANEDSPQIYTLVGRSALSAVKVLRNGLEVTEMAVSELPGNPNAVWTVKRNIDGMLPLISVEMRT